MMIDSANRNIAKHDLVERSLNRTDVVGDPFAQDIFAICDVIIDQDRRVTELVGGEEPVAARHRDPEIQFI